MAEARKMKRVGIIGAGPAGLISAYQLLLQPSIFSVTIFEKTHQTCGLWPQSKFDNQRMIDPHMRTNQSKHTVSFGATGQRLYEKDKEEGEEDVDVFPKAWQVGRYLRRLCDEVTTKGAELRLNTEVVSVEKLEDDVKNGELMKWRVKTRKTTPPSSTTTGIQDGMKDISLDEEEEHVVDHLIIASGFFGRPKIPNSLKPYLSKPVVPPPETSSRTSPVHPTYSSPLGIPVIHSSSFRSLTDLLTTSPIPPQPSSTPATKRKILVIGGSMSGAEIASSLATELSSPQHFPGTPALPNHTTYEILHIATRPFWTLPRYLPLNAKDSAPEFQPLDFVLFNLCNRPRETLAVNRAGEIDEEGAKRGHAYYAALSGQDKPHASVEGDQETDAPWLAICDDYTTHALSGNIKTLRGRLASFATSSQGVSATVETPAGTQTLDGVAAVILATGFSSTNSLNFLSGEIKRTLEFKPDYYIALNLSWKSTISPSLPTLGFVGMYNGPFWGVLEQQALLLSSLWSQLRGSPETRQEAELNLPARLRETESPVPHLRQIEDRDGKARLTQFPMGDYIHVISSLLSFLGKEIPHVPEGVKCYPLVPDTFDSTATSTMSEARRAVQNSIDAGLAGASYPRMLFRALLGKWTLNRTIISKHPSYPSGTLTGSAVFHPRAPTDAQYTGEYLFDEAGEFKTENGLVMRASRRYVWRLEKGKDGEGKGDRLSQWFVKIDGPHKGTGVDYLFHELSIIRPDGTSLSTINGEGMGGSCARAVQSGRGEMPDVYVYADADGEGEGELRGGWASKSSSSTTPKPDADDNLAHAKVKERFWTAKGHHLCIDDTYDPEYVFKWRGAELEEWRMAYTVKGPGKDYWISSRFTRPT